MLVKFSHFDDLERIRRSAKVLKGTPFGISEQLPLEILSRRKQLIPQFQELRSKVIKAYFVKDKIHSNGKEYNPK